MKVVLVTRQGFPLYVRPVIRPRQDPDLVPARHLERPVPAIGRLRPLVGFAGVGRHQNLVPARGLRHRLSGGGSARRFARHIWNTASTIRQIQNYWRIQGSTAGSAIHSTSGAWRLIQQQTVELLKAAAGTIRITVFLRPGFATHPQRAPTLGVGLQCGDRLGKWPGRERDESMPHPPGAVAGPS